MKSSKGDTVMATSTSFFKEELLRMLKVKGESLLSSTPVVVLSTILGEHLQWMSTKLL
jgi:aconitate hydratase 2/2-methylisocitrate dehydratase